MMNNSYSVLMSVYHKECPEYFQAALDSIQRQTLPAGEIILVCDGPLTEGLEQVIQEFCSVFPNIQIIRFLENRGLGYALAEGLQHCSFDLVARMDTDDIAAQDRCELQVAFLQEHLDIDVLSGVLEEFEGNAATVEEAMKQVLSRKELPLSHEEISDYMKYRNPINHPCVMFRRDRVEAAGGYQSCAFFEDYDLWVRMFLNRSRFANLSQTLLYMRVNHMYSRRGGFGYAKAIIAFQVRLFRYGVIRIPQLCCGGVLRVTVSILPNWIRKRIYDAKLRKH